MLIMPYTNTDCMNISLGELSKHYPEAYILLVVDKCCAASIQRPDLPENIEACPLLPYTPELNPIEQIWEELRVKGFRNESSKLWNMLFRVFAPRLTTSPAFPPASLLSRIAIA